VITHWIVLASSRVATTVVFYPVHEPLPRRSHYRGLIQKSDGFGLDVPGSINIPIMVRAAVPAGPLPILHS